MKNMLVMKLLKMLNFGIVKKILITCCILAFSTNNYSRYGKNPFRLVLNILMLKKQLLTVLLHTIYFYIL